MRVITWFMELFKLCRKRGVTQNEREYPSALTNESDEKLRVSVKMYEPPRLLTTSPVKSLRAEVSEVFSLFARKHGVSLSVRELPTDSMNPWRIKGYNYICFVCSDSWNETLYEGGARLCSAGIGIGTTEIESVQNAVQQLSGKVVANYGGPPIHLPTFVTVPEDFILEFSTPSPSISPPVEAP